ncbi:MAG: glycosyltransferase family 4 protein [Ruthenibacterium sp.]
MTYCFFSAQYLPTPGGVERYTESMAHLLRAKGHRVLLVTSALQGLTAQETDAHGVEIFRLPAWQILHGRLPIAKCGTSKRLRALFAHQQIDRVVAQTMLYPLSMLGLRFAAENQISAITITHSTAYVCTGSGLVAKAEQSYERMLAKKAQKYCHAFFGVSQNCNQWLTHFGITAAGVLYNGVDLAGIRAAISQDTQDLRRQNNLPPDTALIAFVGRLIPEKGVLELIAAVKILAQTRSICLLIAGDGPLAKQIEAMQVPYMRFLGVQPREKIFSLLHQSTIYCLPTRYAEGFPTTVLEAAACGTYVMTTNQGGSKELIADASFGTILQETSAKNIAAALEKVLRQPDDFRQKIIDKAQKKVENTFTLAATCAQMEQLPWR